MAGAKPRPGYAWQMLRSLLLVVAAAGLMAGAVVLWTRTLIIFAAPLGVASLAALWVCIDNQFVYRPRRQPPPVESGPTDGNAGA